MDEEFKALEAGNSVGSSIVKACQEAEGLLSEFDEPVVYEVREAMVEQFANWLQG